MSDQGELLRQVVLRVVKQCPQCQQPYEAERVRILGRMGETWLFSLYCHSCQTLAVVGLALAPAAELVSEQEADHDQAGPISADDVLDMHLFLQDLKDFRDL